MTRQLRITPRAVDEIEELARFIALDSLDAAARFQKAAIETGADLLEFPEAHPVINLEVAQALGLRKRTVRGFRNHLIFYTVTDDAVIIQRVIHGARDLPAALRDQQADE